MSIKIALAGNPNSGKTTLFNNLSGSTQHVGNWPGVTVEKKEARLKGQRDVELQDLPGIYSLSPYTLEEELARNYLIDDAPNAILNIVDASNLERNLYLTTQLLELGIPTVVALNMMDVVQKNGDTVQVKKLSEALQCPVVEITAVKGTGTFGAAQKCVEIAQSGRQRPQGVRFSKEVEKAIEGVAAIINGKVSARHTRWFSIKLLERDEKATARVKLGTRQMEEIEKITLALEEKMDDDAESIITQERYAYIAPIIGSVLKKKNPTGLSRSDKIDRIVTNRYLALPIFAAVMFLVYFISVSTIGSMMTDWVNDALFGEIIPPAIGGFLENVGAADWLSSLILDGIVAGVGAVLGFLPQMMVLFLLLAVLEDCGYMARIAFILDRVFRRFGLSGKSFIPMLIGTGCGVPGIMASRTIESDRDRRMTVMTTTFIPCSAKLPIIALIAGALFGGAWWVAPSAYFLGIAAVIVSGIILKKTRMFMGDPSPFVMELPAYHMPRVKGIFMQTWERSRAFIVKAGTIIFLSSAVIWFLGSFNWGMEMVETPDSMLAAIGRVIAPIFNPLGWGDWRAAVATITGLIAKENVVGTFGILYGFAEVAEDGAEIWGALAASFTMLSAYSFLVFNLLCAPCFAAIGAIRREMNSARWTAFAIVYQTVFAYGVALVLYQLGSWIATGIFGMGTVAALAVLAGLLYLLLRPASRANRRSARASAAA